MPLGASLPGADSDRLKPQFPLRLAPGPALSPQATFHHPPSLIPPSLTPPLLVPAPAASRHDPGAQQSSAPRSVTSALPRPVSVQPAASPQPLGAAPVSRAPLLAADSPHIFPPASSRTPATAPALQAAHAPTSHDQASLPGPAPDADSPMRNVHRPAAASAASASPPINAQGSQPPQASPPARSTFPLVLPGQLSPTAIPTSPFQAPSPQQQVAPHPAEQRRPAGQAPEPAISPARTAPPWQSLAPMLLQPDAPPPGYEPSNLAVPGVVTVPQADSGPMSSEYRQAPEPAFHGRQPSFSLPTSAVLAPPAGVPSQAAPPLQGAQALSPARVPAASAARMPSAAVPAHASFPALSPSNAAAPALPAFQPHQTMSGVSFAPSPQMQASQPAAASPQVSQGAAPSAAVSAFAGLASALSGSGPIPDQMSPSQPAAVLPAHVPPSSSPSFSSPAQQPFQLQGASASQPAQSTLAARTQPPQVAPVPVSSQVSSASVPIMPTPAPQPQLILQPPQDVPGVVSPPLAARHPASSQPQAPDSFAADANLQPTLHLPQLLPGVVSAPRSGPPAPAPLLVAMPPERFPGSTAPLPEPARQPQPVSGSLPLIPGAQQPALPSVSGVVKPPSSSGAAVQPLRPLPHFPGVVHAPSQRPVASLPVPARFPEPSKLAPMAQAGLSPLQLVSSGLDPPTSSITAAISPQPAPSQLLGSSVENGLVHVSPSAAQIPGAATPPGTPLPNNGALSSPGLTPKLQPSSLQPMSGQPAPIFSPSQLGRLPALSPLSREQAAAQHPSAVDQSVGIHGPTEDIGVPFSQPVGPVSLVQAVLPSPALAYPRVRPPMQSAAESAASVLPEAPSGVNAAVTGLQTCHGRHVRCQEFAHDVAAVFMNLIWPTTWHWH